MEDDHKKPYRPNIGTGKLVWQVTPYGPTDAEANKLGTGSPITMDYEGGYAALNGDDLDLYDDVRVHRIMRFDEYGLEHVVTNQALAFVTHHHWKDDDHEGYLAREMKTKEGIERVAKILHENNVESNPVLTAAVLQMLTYSLHMQSWTHADEKSEMWDDYSPADRTGVRVTTSLGKLRQMGHLFVNRVIYRDLLTLEEEVKEVFPNPEVLPTMSFTQLFRRKRTKYGYEEEVRLIANSFIFGQPSREKTIREISFAGIEDFIESVTVDPLAEDEHVVKVRDFCLAHNITFAGRSKVQGCKHKKT